MSDEAEKGQSARHTRATGAGDGADPAPSSADQALPGRELADLVAGSPDLEAKDVLAVAAELVAAPRRGRGRPPGSPNRKNRDMIEYLAALGHRDPWVTLSMIQTADTVALSRSLSMKRGEVLALQLRAAEALMPYHHAKQPQQLDLPIGGEGWKRPFMAIGELHGNVLVAADGTAALSIHDAPAKIVENQGVGEAASVRPEGEQSDAPATALKNQHIPDQNS